MLSDGVTLVGDVLVPAGLLLTVVTGVGTVHWLKGKRRLAFLAPLSVVSVIGIIGITRVARPTSPWARWRYSADRMAQARIRFGGPAPERVERLAPPATAGFGLVLAGVVGGVPLGAVTSLVGGGLVAHALLASAGRPGSGRVVVALAVAAVPGQGVVAALDPGDWRTWPAAGTTLVVTGGAALLRRSARTRTRTACR